MTEKDFSLRLAKLREEKGVSARDMSLSMGQNPGYINNIESGKSMPSLSGIFYICEYLGISPKDFFAIRGNCDIGGSACLELMDQVVLHLIRDDLYIHFLRLCTLFDRIDFAIVSVTEVAVVVGS